MDFLLTNVKFQFALVYINAIAILLRTPDQPIDHVPEVLTPLRDASVNLNLKKCDFFTNGIDKLGQSTCSWLLEV